MHARHAITTGLTAFQRVGHSHSDATPTHHRPLKSLMAALVRSHPLLQSVRSLYALSLLTHAAHVAAEDGVDSEARISGRAVRAYRTAAQWLCVQSLELAHRRAETGLPTPQLELLERVSALLLPPSPCGARARASVLTPSSLYLQATESASLSLHAVLTIIACLAESLLILACNSLPREREVLIQHAEQMTTQMVHFISQHPHLLRGFDDSSYLDVRPLLLRQLARVLLSRGLDSAVPAAISMYRQALQFKPKSSTLWEVGALSPLLSLCCVAPLSLLHSRSLPPNS